MWHLLQGKPLAEGDLVNISMLGKMITSRPQGKLVSHQVSAWAYERAAAVLPRISAVLACSHHIMLQCCQPARLGLGQRCLASRQMRCCVWA